MKGYYTPDKDLQCFSQYLKNLELLNFDWNKNNHKIILPKKNMVIFHGGFHPTKIQKGSQQNHESRIQIQVHPRNLTWIPKITIFQRRYLLKTIILGIHVSFSECKAWKFWWDAFSFLGSNLMTIPARWKNHVKK